MTDKSRYNKGTITSLPHHPLKFQIPVFTLVWKNHPCDLALSCPLRRVHGLRVGVQRDSTIGVQQKFLCRFHTLAFGLEQCAEGVAEGALDDHEDNETRFCIRSLRDARQNPEEEYSHREHRGLLRREALKLPLKYRSILKACELDERSIEEVAHLHGIHVGAAKSRMQPGICAFRW